MKKKPDVELTETEFFAYVKEKMLRLTPKQRQFVRMAFRRMIDALLAMPHDSDIEAIQARANEVMAELDEIRKRNGL